MFYSHQLLARKAPLGQIWMAATMHAKINRKKLDKLDIIQICEEILNPSVPMALRLSSILMGGVVIVYERKVKLLYDDVTRLLVEVNAAWKVKTVSDPTILPKAKSQAKFEAVTLPEHMDMEMERSILSSDAAVPTARFQHMRLDDLDEYYINIDVRDDDLADTHQADAENITLFDDLGSGLGDTKLYNHFERFDTGDDVSDTQINFTSQEQPQFEATLRPSPNRVAEPRNFTSQEQPQFEATLRPSPNRVAEPRNFTLHQHATVQNHEMEEAEQKDEDLQKEPLKRRPRRNPNHLIMDNEQLMIPGNIYQSWLQDTSDIVSKRGRTVTECLRSVNPIRSTKISNLMELPPVALVCGLEKLPAAAVHYPAPLMELWRKCAEVTSANTALSENNSSLAHQRKVPEMGDIVSDGLDGSIEKLRANLENLEFQGNAGAFTRDRFATPGSLAGQSSRSIPSSGSGHMFMPLEPEIQLNSGRTKRKQNSSSATNFGNLDPVEEEFIVQQPVRDFKIRRLSETDTSPEFELLVETGATQTPIPPSDTSGDRTTELIRTHLKLHFDTPGAPSYESLDQLSLGMNKKRAAQLFYQTCVLATFDFIKVEQHEPYGDIAISRGPKM